MRCYPLVQTHQHQQVCDWVLAPASVPHAVQAYARNIAASLLTAINYVGVISIELFYGPSGLQVNEIAPAPTIPAISRSRQPIPASSSSR